MNKVVSFALLIAGILLIGYGLNASDSIGSSFSRFFTGSPTDRTIWLLLAGIAAAIVGAGGLLFRGNKTP